MKVKTNYANAPVWKVNVKSRIPEPLKMLGKMARNIWWAWNDEATEMFRELILNYGRLLTEPGRFTGTFKLRKIGGFVCR